MNETEFLKLIINTLDKLNDEQVKIRETLAANHEVLKDHTRRSIANEEAVSILEEKYEEEKGKLREEFLKQIEPIKEHVQFVNFTLKILGVIGAAAGVAVCIIQIVDRFIK